MKKKRLDVCKIFQVQTNFHARCIVRTLCGPWIWYTQIPGKWQLTLMYISPTATQCHTRLLKGVFKAGCTADLADNVAGQLQNAINCRKWPAQYRLRVARARSVRGTYPNASRYDSRTAVSNDAAHWCRCAAHPFRCPLPATASAWSQAELLLSYPSGLRLLLMRLRQVAICQKQLIPLAAFSAY